MIFFLHWLFWKTYITYKNISVKASENLGRLWVWRVQINSKVVFNLLKCFIQETISCSIMECLIHLSVALSIFNFIALNLQGCFAIWFIVEVTIWQHLSLLPLIATVWAQGQQVSVLSRHNAWKRSPLSDACTPHWFHRRVLGTLQRPVWILGGGERWSSGETAVLDSLTWLILQSANIKEN